MEQVLLFLIAYVVVLGTATAWLALERGRHGVSWFFVGAVLGPLAILMVGFAPRQAIGSRYRECVECVEPMDARAITCPHCASEQPD